MNLDNSEIIKLKNSVSRQFLCLRRIVSAYIDIEKSLNMYRDSFHSNVNRFLFNKPSHEDILGFEKITDMYRQSENDRLFILRDIDNTIGIISSYISFSLDYCLENYNENLRFWINTSLENLVEICERLQSQHPQGNIYFPTATNTLAGYIYKTRAYPNPQKYVRIRNLIRRLIKRI